MNCEFVKQARDVALGLLKPSSRDLDYGLRLHREALVVESYSLGLHAPVDAAAVNAAIDGGASSAEVQLLRTELGVTGWVKTKELQDEFRELWDSAGVTASFQNAGQEGNDIQRLIERLAHHTSVTDRLPGIVRRAPFPEAIEEAHREGKHAVIFTTNGVPIPSGQPPLSESLRFIRIFAQLGVRMMHLTYNRRNLLGDGCAETANAGLSDFGREAIREMNRAGVIVDLAHSGWQTTIEAAAISERPVVISHAAAYALREHIRTKSDAVIRAVVEKGGTIGITNVPSFLGESGTITRFLDHIEYVVKTFGDDAVTIGTDRPMHSRHSEEATKACKPLPASRPGWENYWPTPPTPPEWSKPEQILSLAWTNWPLFTVGLVQRGFSDETIRKIIGGNIMRVFREVSQGAV